MIAEIKKLEKVSSVLDPDAHERPKYAIKLFNTPSV